MRCRLPPSVSAPYRSLATENENAAPGSLALRNYLRHPGEQLPQKRGYTPLPNKLSVVAPEWWLWIWCMMGLNVMVRSEKFSENSQKFYIIEKLQFHFLDVIKVLRIVEVSDHLNWQKYFKAFQE